MNYDNMTDKAINLAVYEHFYGNPRDDKDMSKLFFRGKLDYCNTASIAWPIIVDNGISVVFNSRTEQVRIYHRSINFIVNRASTLKYCMIVFLMMQEGK